MNVKDCCHSHNHSAPMWSHWGGGMFVVVPKAVVLVGVEEERIQGEHIAVGQVVAVP